MTSSRPGPEWWRTAVVYQVYPRSFADADGDGIGDLPGLTARLPYLAELGVDALWLTPFYPSPLADGGYDVADHRDVDPRLGTLADADALIAGAHERGIRVLIDIVPNHTSDQHAWFVEALAAGPGSAARDRYHFRDGSGPDGAEPPSDWVSHFGGSAWDRLPDGQWYLHLFAREQPDLNWDNADVRAAFEDTLRFWADRGVDGFRIDVAHALVKDMSEPLRSQTTLDTALPLDGTDPLYDRDGLHEIYRSWRRVFDEYDPPRMAVAETWTPTSFRNYLYARPDELGQVFDFALSKAPWDRDTFATVVRTSLADQFEYAGADGGLTWVLSSHDVPRHVSRLALDPSADVMAWLSSNDTDPAIDVAAGLRRGRAATLLMLALPGSAYLYQGEELGLPEVADLPADALQDPIWERTGHALKGRDGCRVPLPWTRSGPSHGFGSGTGWLPQPTEFGDLSVEAQDGAAGSTLELYRTALALRRTLQTHDNAVEFVPSADPQVLHVRRSNGWECVVNFGSAPTALPPGEVLLTTAPTAGELPGESAVWLRA